MKRLHSIFLLFYTLPWGSGILTGCDRSFEQQAANISSATDSDTDIRAPRGPATVILGGDMMIGGKFNEFLSATPTYELFRFKPDAFKPADMFLFNLETVITDRTDSWPDKTYLFQLSPALLAPALATLPIDSDTPLMASLANNHTMDFFDVGMADTISALEEQRILHVGAGPDSSVARAAQIVTSTKGIRIGVLAASTHCSCGVDGWDATVNTPGIWQFGPSSQDELEFAVSALRTQVDWLLLSLHFGPNWTDEWPINAMVRLAEDLADLGPDVIFGHSSHMPLPTMYINSTLVLFGSGDLINDYGPIVEGYRVDLGFIARVQMTPNQRPQLSLFPHRIETNDEIHVLSLDDTDSDYAIVLNAAALQVD